MSDCELPVVVYELEMQRLWEGAIDERFVRRSAVHFAIRHSVSFPSA